jgi:hypothetical protein
MLRCRIMHKEHYVCINVASRMPSTSSSRLVLGHAYSKYVAAKDLVLKCSLKRLYENLQHLSIQMSIFRFSYWEKLVKWTMLSVTLLKPPMPQGRDKGRGEAGPWTYEHQALSDRHYRTSSWIESACIMFSAELNWLNWLNVLASMFSLASPYYYQTT